MDNAIVLMVRGGGGGGHEIREEEIRHNELFDLLDSSCNKFIKKNRPRTFNAIKLDAENFLEPPSTSSILSTSSSRNYFCALHPSAHSTFDASSVLSVPEGGRRSGSGCPNTRDFDGNCRLRSVGFQLQIRVEHEQIPGRQERRE